ncbi:hypothetical protein PtrSN002B_003672 [Pyrenophora tritici-repentis]|uniref:Uncharacterized protein n=2 Tax=Pyrenophora tritici-repentis TaxID=45151 RepID=A0A2W1I005_9PLEO|nr:uncharacterized protein PTRG_03859 [Pyrenophora tritici-repentis Pt-1C-BFP]KAA8620083.1 hypothetical protein PtrV1_07177 [Pyrenophora tritici-repentis]EDU46697.1 predicted protein [Pyrenophora tritici-repentis Pt-1C-BFP]KAF7571948.1 hypothetical protein PtrM4_094480 [Pyrenophora tritici-repentis]KAG9384864.1 hypothetical protein A1F94_004411 [Pyrenophora tritici-repentis]KAI0585530.1 hypothetical protein Alg215_02478 [Pyrenophora tritici-repentis]
MAEKTDLQRVLPTGNSRYHLITEVNMKNSPLLCLPAELPTMIYEYALEGTIIDVRYKHHAPLILSCRQIQHEAPPLEFSRVTFFYFDIISLLDPRVAPGQDTRNMITSISVTFSIMHYLVSGSRRPHGSHEYDKY